MSSTSDKSEVNESGIDFPEKCTTPTIESIAQENTANTTIKDLTVNDIPLKIVLSTIIDKIAKIDVLFDRLNLRMEELTAQVVLLPKQVRQLGAKVDGVVESIAQPRIRDMLGRMLQLHDIVEQMCLGKEHDAQELANYRMIRDQIITSLHIEGISVIPSDGRFDPSVHKAVETKACASPEEDGLITRTYRTGFRTQQAILRYSEVIVKRHVA